MSNVRDDKKNAKDQQEFLELEQRFWDALKERDIATAVELTDFPCLLAGAQGVSSVDKQAFMAMMKSPSYTINSAELSDIQVRRVSSDVVVVAYKVHEELMVDGKSIELDAADSSTWIRRDGHWACAAHSEVIAGDPFGRDRRAQSN
jgi:hypothetical protein